MIDFLAAASCIYQLHCAGYSLLPPHALSTLSNSALCYKRLLIITSITCLPCLNFPLCSANGEWRKDEKGIYSLGFCPKGSTWTTEKLISFDSYLHSALHGIAPSPLLGGLGTVKEPLFLTWATKLFLVVSFM